MDELYRKIQDDALSLMRHASHQTFLFAKSVWHYSELTRETIHAIMTRYNDIKPIDPQAQHVYNMFVRYMEQFYESVSDAYTKGEIILHKLHNDDDFSGLLEDWQNVNEDVLRHVDPRLYSQHESTIYKWWTSLIAFRWGVQYHRRADTSFFSPQNAHSIKADFEDNIFALYQQHAKIFHTWNANYVPVSSPTTQAVQQQLDAMHLPEPMSVDLSTFTPRQWLNDHIFTRYGRPVAFRDMSMQIHPC